MIHFLWPNLKWVREMTSLYYKQHHLIQIFWFLIGTQAVDIWRKKNLSLVKLFGFAYVLSFFRLLEVVSDFFYRLNKRKLRLYG